MKYLFSLFALGALSLTILGVQECETEPDPDLQWYYTCGDPVCSGWTPKEGVALCEGESVGATCGDAGATCDPQDQCNALLICAEEDPRQQPGGCPISSQSVKKEIHYLDDAERLSLHQQLTDLPLAEYRYKGKGADGQKRLGFIIEDAPTSPAIDQPKDMIDLYSYTSMAVAAIQVQNQKIEDLEKKMKEMEGCKTVSETAK